LVLGMGALNYLTLEQFRSVMAHEYGHFSHKDTFFSRFIYRVSHSYEALLSQLSGSQIQYLNPFYWLLRGYVGLYHLIAASFSRRREFFADRFAVLAYGPQIFQRALVASHVEGSFFSQVGMRRVLELAHEGKGFKNGYHYVGANRKFFENENPQAVREIT